MALAAAVETTVAELTRQDGRLLLQVAHIVLVARLLVVLVGGEYLLHRRADLLRDELVGCLQVL